MVSTVVPAVFVFIDDVIIDWGDVVWGTVENVVGISVVMSFVVAIDHSVDSKSK